MALGICLWCVSSGVFDNDFLLFWGSVSLPHGPQVTLSDSFLEYPRGLPEPQPGMFNKKARTGLGDAVQQATGRTWPLPFLAGK